MKLLIFFFLHLNLKELKVELIYLCRQQYG